MKTFVLSGLLLTFSLLLSSISCNRQDRDHSSEKEKGKLVELSQMEVELKSYYQKVEEDLRTNHGIRDQKKIDIMMQIFIDDGDVDAPFILETKGGIPHMTYVSYSEYKKYHSTPHLIDTVKTFSISFDSLGRIKNSDTIE